MFFPARPTPILPAALSLAVLALGGCTSTMEQVSRTGEDPKLTQIENPTEQDHHQPVDMPMPQAGEQRHQPNSLWRRGAAGFFQDQRANRTGDLLTVEIQVDDQASLENSTETSHEAEEDLGVSSFFGLTGILESILPADDADSGDLVSAQSSSSSEGEGEIERTEEINMEIAAVVTQVMPNGNMVIQGRQETRVNAELRELMLTGIVRPQDISADNTIAYQQIAEARLSYGGRGTVSDSQGPRYGQQLYQAVAPF